MNLSDFFPLLLSATISLLAVQSSDLGILTLGQLRGKQQLTLLQRKHDETAKVIDESIVYCRVTLVDTMYAIDNDKIEHRHETSCIPIIHQVEMDDLFPIDLPESILSQYHEEISAGSLLVSVTKSSVGIHRITTSQRSKYVVYPNRSLDRRYLATHTSSTTATKLHIKSVMTVAVVRISTTDSTPKFSASTLNDTFFGSSTNSFVKQYDKCSFGKLTWKLVPQGVIDLKLNKTVSSYGSASTIVEAAQHMLKSNMGITELSSLADRVIMCLPPGTGTWAARAGVNHWRVQMNSDWCISLTGTMHEIGHTLGLMHARQNGIQYEDRTGVMGSGYVYPNGPRKCFNAYNAYQLGWYRTRQLDLNLAVFGASPGQLITLATFVDFDKTNSTEPVVVNIANKYFLLYNRKKDFNTGTEQKADQVVVTSPIPDGTDTVAGLSPGNKFYARNFHQGKTLVIEACKATTSQTGKADVMLISVALNRSLCHKVVSQPSKKKYMLKSTKKFLTWLTSLKASGV